MEQEIYPIDTFYGGKHLHKCCMPHGLVKQNPQSAHKFVALV